MAPVQKLRKFVMLWVLELGGDVAVEVIKWHVDGWVRRIPTKNPIKTVRDVFLAISLNV